MRSKPQTVMGVAVVPRMHNPIKILVSSTLHAEMVEYLAGYVNIASNTVQNIRLVITGARAVNFIAT